jgi:hypothetical protein
MFTSLQELSCSVNLRLQCRATFVDYGLLSPKLRKSLLQLLPFSTSYRGLEFHLAHKTGIELGCIRRHGWFEDQMPVRRSRADSKSAIEQVD